MRHIGTLANSTDAQRFAAYLITQDIPAQVEQEGSEWILWIRNEDQVEAAKEALAHFRTNPQDARYSGVESKALQIARAEREKAAKAKKNVVEMRGQWRTGSGSAFKRAPLISVLIGLSIFVYFLQQTDSNSVSPAQRWLSFSSVWAGSRPGMMVFPRDGYTQIREGQVWRLVTPIFLHFSIMHIVFNMMLLYSLGSIIEQRYGAWRVALMVLLIAVFSNTAQYVWEGTPTFGGMSGVVYGLFGFAWMKMLYDPRSGLFVSQQLVVMSIVWLFLGMASVIPPFDQFLSWFPRVANTAHFVGLAVGMACAGITLLMRRPA